VLDPEPNTAAAEQDAVQPARPSRRRRAASRPAGPPEQAAEATPAVVTAPEVVVPPEPQVAEPEVAEPEVAEPEVAEPEVAEPEVAEPGTAQPQVAEPEVAEPGTAQPQDAEPQAGSGSAEAATAQPAEGDVARPAPLFASTAPSVERRPRRRATAAAGPPAADIFTAPPTVPDLDDLLPPPVPSTGTEPEQTETGRARGGRSRRGRRRGAEGAPDPETTLDMPLQSGDGAPAAEATPRTDAAADGASEAGTAEETPAPARRSRSRARAEVAPVPEPGEQQSAEVTSGAEAPAIDLSSTVAGTSTLDAGPGGVTDDADGGSGDGPDEATDDTEDGGRPRRGGRSRRRRGGRGRSSAGEDTTDGSEEDSDDEAGTGGPRGPALAGGRDDTAEDDEDDEDAGSEEDEDEDDGDGTGEAGGSRSSRRRRRRRRRSGGDADLTVDPDDPPGTVVRIRESRTDEVTKLKGSTRLEAKRQRRRDGRTTSRKRTVITEAEFLTRRESVDRTLLVREGEDRTEIAVLEDGVLVEHHVTRASQQSMIGNVYLGKVQNVLPSMEAAFVDIGRGRNAVLYAGEVNWDAFGMTGGSQRKIEDALKPGDPVLAQVSKDPIGHKGARLTAQISLPGRYLVYVPGSSMTGISRKLPENERTRLKKVLRRVVPEDAGVIVRTAAEGASEAELERDVARLQAQWGDIEAKSKAVQAPARLYSEPDLAIKVVRDVFNEDFTLLVVSGDDTWDTLDGYVRHVAPDLAERMTRWVPQEGAEQDLFVHHRIDEQIAKALDRKVWLPSGGSLVIDRTEAMTVVDVNTGKYTGNGGNLEETVTRNNLEAAEETVRQLRLRDIGGIIVVDFIDMVLESNRNLVLRRLVECLGRDRTKHQVAEVTSLGLVQLTRKRVGSGLLESFSTPCEHCQGRGLITHAEPVGAGNEPALQPPAPDVARGGGPRRRGGRPGG